MSILTITAASSTDEDLLRAVAAEVAKRHVTAIKSIPNIELLGQGAFARVYTHPTDKKKVIKVVRDDACWRLYADLATRKRRNRAMPKIHAYKEFKSQIDPNLEWGVYIMERLIKWSPKMLKVAHRRDPHTVEYLLNPDTSALGARAKRQARRILLLPDLVANFKRRWDTRFGDMRPPPIAGLIKRLERKCRLDLHKGNIMFRPNGDVVLNDPVAGMLQE